MSMTQKNRLLNWSLYEQRSTKVTIQQWLKYWTKKLSEYRCTDFVCGIQQLSLMFSSNATSFYRFQMSVRKQELYRENDPLVEELLHDLATSPIESVGMVDRVVNQIA